MAGGIRLRLAAPTPLRNNGTEWPPRRRPPGPVPSIRGPTRQEWTPLDDSAQPSRLWWNRSLPRYGPGHGTGAITRLPCRPQLTSAASSRISRRSWINVVKLIQTAPIEAWWRQLAIATQNSNKYFSGVGAEKVGAVPAARTSAAPAMPEARRPGPPGPDVPPCPMPGNRRLHALSCVGQRGSGGGDDQGAGAGGCFPLDRRADPGSCPPGALGGPAARTGRSRGRNERTDAPAWRPRTAGPGPSGGWLFIRSLPASLSAWTPACCS